jgi:tungstate transport system permease protein
MIHSMEIFSLAWRLIVDGDSALWSVFARSLGVSGLATVLAAVVGVLLGAWLSVVRFRGRRLVLGLCSTLLALPSVVVGLLVYLMLSRTGPLGSLGWLFSMQAMVFAQALLVLPVVIALTRQCIEQAHDNHGEQLQALAAPPGLRAALLVWDERWALGTILIAAFGRAISEVGAVMIVGGNIEGYTRVMTTAIALETSKGDLPMALALGLVLLGLVMAMHALASGMQWLVQAGAQASAQSSMGRAT